MKRNVTLLYAIRAVRSFMLVIAVAVPFFQENGLSQTQIFMLQSIFAIGVLALEVPSGYFADHVGRKASLMLGGVLTVLGFIIYTFAYGFWPIALAELVIGFGLSFVSGADVALLYDSLKELKSADQYRKTEANTFGLIGISEALASVAGGGLALISLRLPFVLQGFVYAGIIPLTAMLREPPVTKSAEINPFRDVMRVTKYALHGHTEIKWLIFYSAIIGTLTHTMVWLTQPYYQLVGIPLGWFGVLWAVQFVMLALFAHFADRYEVKLGKKNALISFVGIGVVAYALLGALPYIVLLPVILCFYFIRGVQATILRDYLNVLVESDIRATVLSVQNFAQKLLYTGLGPLIGLVMDVYSLQAALLFSALLYSVLGIFVLAKMAQAKLL